MKKILIVSLIVTSLVGSNITFAQPSTPQSVKFTKDLLRINDDLLIAIRNTLNPESDKDSLIKDINFIKTKLDSVLSTVAPLDKSEKNPLKKREFYTIAYITALNYLVINGLLLYLDNKSTNEDFLLDAIAEYRVATEALYKLRDSLANAYNVKF